MDNNINQKSTDDLKKLYGKEYVEKFSKIHTSSRIEGFLPYMDLTKTDRVVDFACGNGLLLEQIASKILYYVGVDFSEDFIKEAVEKQNHLGIKNASFVCSDIKYFCEANPQSFDCAFALDFFEHVYDEELLKILVSIKKSLKPGGSLYIHTPNLLFFIEQMKQHSFILKQFPEHIAVRSPEQLAHLLNQAGFKVEKLLLHPHYNVLKYVHFLSHLPVVGKYFEARIFIEAKSLAKGIKKIWQ